MVAVLGFVLLCIYVAFAFVFAAGTIVVAAQALFAMLVSASIATPETISFAGTFAVGLCFWIPFILCFCRHLLLLYMQVVTPMIAAVLVCAGEIAIPSYPWLWAILISMQACCYLFQATGAIDRFLSFLCVMPIIFAIGIFHCIDFLAIVYPWVVNKNYTRRWHRLSAYFYSRHASAFGWGLFEAIIWIRPAVSMSVLYLLQFYVDYLGPVGSMTVVSVLHTLSDLLCCSAALLAIGMWATNIHFRGGLCPSISMALTSGLSYSVGSSLATTCTMVLLELYNRLSARRAKTR